jgi:hypothetical protein
MTGDEFSRKANNCQTLVQVDLVPIGCRYEIKRFIGMFQQTVDDNLQPIAFGQGGLLHFTDHKQCFDKHVQVIASVQQIEQFLVRMSEGL